jgi:hypothetical protein
MTKGLPLRAVLLALLAALQPAANAVEAAFDTVISGGRVMDPESGLDGVRDLGLRAGRIVAISEQKLQASRIIDATGLVVSPGFIDLHSHAMTTPSARIQAFDGVTTALELELGSLPIAAAYESMAREGRPINYGFSVSWALARMKVLDGVAVDGRTSTYSDNFGKPKWRSLVSRPMSQKVLDEVELGLKQGALGVGIMVGYAPNSNREEYLGLAKLAARYHVPTFTHVRATNHDEPGSYYEGFAEVISAAVASGAHMHLCHINSSSWRDINAVTNFIAQAQQRGIKVTTEAYPYGAGSTTIGAARYAPENLPLSGIKSSDIYLVETNSWIKDDDELRRVRAERPQALAIFHFLSEKNTDDRKLLRDALLFPGTVIASDAVPYTTGRTLVEGDVWPLPANADAHPRVAGTFSRVVGRWVREDKVLTLMDALRRSTLAPAQLMEEAAPQMKLKGRIRVGADADIVVFDPATLSDRASYENPRLPSVGMRHVIVAGQSVIQDGELVRSALPGKPVRGPNR